jgi:hypothetical protein
VSLFIAALVLAIGADVAQAGTLEISDSSRRTGGSWSGGEFAVSEYDDALYPPGEDPNNVDTYQFHTFCLEKNEHISLGGEYDYVISTSAKAGGGGATNGSDPLSAATAKLYFAYWTNQWDINNANIAYDYDADSNGKAWSKALQEAIWYLEGETTATLTGRAKDLYDYAMDDLSWEELGQDWDEEGIGAVRVLNLYVANTNLGTRAQDQLVVVPLPGAAIMGFGLLGTMGLVALRRRRSRASVA